MKLKELEARLLILTDALEFYADPNSWKRRVLRINEFGNKCWRDPDVAIDKGARARFVLETMSSTEINTEHTSDDMCGCSTCAEKADRGEF